MQGRYPIGDVHAQIAIARRMLARNGCESGPGGHVSVRIPGQDACWVSPVDQYFDETIPEDIGVWGFDNEQRDGERKLGGALRFHSSIYKHRPDVNSVIHTHSDYVAHWSTTGRPVPIWHQDAAPFLDGQAYYVEDGIKPIVDAQEIAELMAPDKRVVFFKNHGCVIATDSLEHSTISAILLEKACEYAYKGEAVRGTPMGERESIYFRKSIMGFYAGNMWTANVRRLRRSDPDLFEHIEDDGRFEGGLPFVKGERKSAR